MAIQVNGVDTIIAALDKIADTSNLKQAVGQACAIVEESAKRKAPKRTGDLRRSIQSKVETKGNDVVGVIYSPLEYAPYVEYGTGLFAEKGGRKKVPWAYKDEDTGELIFTKGQHPQPYLRPALNENRTQIIRTIEEGVKG